MAGNDLQPTSFSITPDAVRIGECYTIQVESGANITLDLRYTHNEGEPQTITGWPTLDGDGTAPACPTLTSQLGNYEFTHYKNTQASEWLSSSETLEVIEALEDTDFSSADGSYRGQVSGVAGSDAFRGRHGAAYRYQCATDHDSGYQRSIRVPRAGRWKLCNPGPQTGA